MGIYSGGAYGRAVSLQTQANQKAAYELERKRRMAETSPMRDYESAIMARGKTALEGRYNVAEDPQFRATRAGLEKTQGRTLSDIEQAGAKGGLGGFSASYLSEKMKETGADTLLNLAASMQGRQEELVKEGSTAGKNIFAMLSPEQQAEIAMRLNFAQEETQATLKGSEMSSNEQIQKHAQIQSGFNSGMSGCCYIFYAGDKFIRAVHMFRDEFYPNESFVGLGYRLMAQWLVPIMKRNNFVKKFVIFIMLDPLAKYAMAYYQRQAWKKFILIPFKLFWPNVWAVYGRTALAYEKTALRLGI